MLVHYLLSAVLLGFIVAIPPGSVTVISIQRALQYGFINSLIFTIGSCLSDLFFIFVVYFGFSSIMETNAHFKVLLWTICGILLIYIGITTILTVKDPIDISKSEKNLQSKRFYTFISGVLVTLVNPLTIIGWVAMAGNFFLTWDAKFPESRNYMILSIFLIMSGVLAWFLPLIFFISKLQRFVGHKLQRNIILISGMCLLIFGAVSLFSALRTTIEKITG